MVAVPINNNQNFLDVDLLNNLKNFIKEIISKYKMNRVEKQLNSIIEQFAPLMDKDIEIKNDNDVKELNKFSDYLSDLEEFLENLEDMGIDNKIIQQKIDKSLDIVVVLNCRVAGRISDYMLEGLCE